MSLQAILSDWSFEPSVMLPLLLLAALYLNGRHYARVHGIGRQHSGWRTASFFGGLLAVVVALESPIDAWADVLLTVHMVQHIVLIFAAAPLLVLGAPIWPLWRGIPLAWRRALLGWATRQHGVRALGEAVGGWVRAPRIVWALFVGDFLAWHAPALYDLALRYQLVHDLEHLLFLVTALLFWTQLITSAPLRPRLSLGQQAGYSYAACMAMAVVAMVLIFDVSPIYGYYASQARPALLSSVTVDQAAAGAVMVVAAFLEFGTLLMALVWRWLGADERRSESLTSALLAGQTGLRVIPLKPAHVEEPVATEATATVAFEGVPTPATGDNTRVAVRQLGA